jgi:ABC-type sugar transport system substrate-binding protein
MRKNVFSVLCILCAVVLLVSACTAAQKAPTSTQAVAASTKVAATIPLPAGGHVAAKVVSDKPLKIIFLGWGSNPFHDEVRKGVEAAAAYLKNYNTTVTFVSMGADFNIETEIAAIQGATAQEYNGMAGIFGFDGVIPTVDAAVDAGIPMVGVVANFTKPSKQLFFMGTDAYDAGKSAGEIIAKYMGGKGKMGIVTGLFGAGQHQQRIDGALDYLKANYPDITNVGTYENQDKAELAYSYTKDMLTANPDLKLIYVTAGGPGGAAKAVQDLGLTGKVAVVGYDWLPDALQYVKSGEIIALLSQDPFGQGFDSMVLLHNYLTTGEKPAGDLKVDSLVVTPDTLSKLVPDFK